MERYELFRGNARRVQYPSSQSDISNEAAYLRRHLDEPERLRIETECVEALIADYEHRIACWDYFQGATTASKFSLGLLAGYVLLRVTGPRFLHAREVARAKGITLLASLGLGIRACIYLISSSHHLIDRKSPRARLRAMWNGLSIETKEIFNRLAYLLDVSVGHSHFSSFGTYKTFTQTTPARPTYPIYKPLNGCSGWLRVLEVLPGCPGTMVECQLHMVFGSGSGSYEALSYVWGDSTQKGKLRVNGIVIEITQNLASALQCVRDRNISRRLWVDAICINQTDEEEKNDQVAKMAYIFRGSKRVLTFLGPDDDCSEVFDYLDSVKPDGGGNESAITLRVLKAFWALLLKPWWSRIWVIQEFICAPELVVGCGRRWVNEAKFFEGFEKLKTELLFRIEEQPQSTLSHLGSASLVSVRKVLNMRHALLNRRMDPSRNLPDLFRETRGYLASDPRDKIFAINLFMPEPFRTMLRPNYTQTRETVYTRLTTILLSIIGWSELYTNYSLSRDGSLPSWVPDYSQPYPDGADLGRMSGQVSGTREIECSVAYGTLSIQGFEIDSIEKVHAVHEHNAILLHREFLRIESQIEREFQIEKHQGFHTPLQDLVKEPLLHIVMGEQTSPTRKEGDGTIPDQENQQKKDLHISNFVNSVSHCSVFTTKRGLVGVGTPDAKRGDKLILLFGMPTPFILRTGPGSYNMVGLGRAGGIMHGELMEHFESGFFQEQTFFID
ncbi:hypothetical protein ACMFMG_006360 [Clarireedia jacksonii]